MESPPGKWGGQYNQALGDLKFSPTSGGGLAKWVVRFKIFHNFFRVKQSAKLLKFVCLSQAKFNFSCEIIFSE